jgi:hypothetical protein
MHTYNRVHKPLSAQFKETTHDAAH